MELPLLELREMGVSFGQRVILDDITLSLPSWNRCFDGTGQSRKIDVPEYPERTL